MIPRDRLVLLDTNVLLHLVRNNAAGKWIEQTYGLRARTETPLVSVVTIGEMFRLASRTGRKWGVGRQEFLQTLMRELVIVDVGEPGIALRYGEIGASLDERGQKIPQNDVWIAATASAKSAVLLTADKHFDRLHPRYVEREFIDPDQLPRSSR